jgi:hypothetical protein
MKLLEFKASITNDTPPAGINLALQAMWYEAKGNWDKAHSLIQQQDDAIGAWIHAYLHRQEGDEWNANYWYSRAGRVMPDQSLADEWEDITATLLES